MLPSGESWYWLTALPIWNVLLPASDIDIETWEPAFIAFIMSAMRPPQPVRAGWSGMPVCQCTVWPLGEKRRGGRPAGPARRPPAAGARGGLVGGAGVPVHRLVAVREELRRQRGGTGQQLRPRHRRDQGADVGDDREPLLGEQVAQAREAGME